MNQQGRSMIEMLGVLAIIGVLSVGAIAGYSKAMMKYRLNKQAQQIGLIINNLLSNSEKFSRAFENTAVGNKMDIMIKLNIIPEEMLRPKNMAKDVFGNNVDLGYGTDGVKRVGVNIKFMAIKSSGFMEQCINIYTVLQQFSAYMWFVQPNLVLQERPPDFSERVPRIYGDTYCNKDYTVGYCLKDKKLTDIEKLCRNIQEMPITSGIIGFNFGI